MQPHDPGLARAALPQWKSTTGHNQQLGSPQAALSPPAKASRPCNNGPQSILGVELKLSSEQNVAYLGVGWGGARETFLPWEMKESRTWTESTSPGQELTSRRLLNASFVQRGGSSPSFASAGESVKA
jgi:hypothetical protein